MSQCLHVILKYTSPKHTYQALPVFSHHRGGVVGSNLHLIVNSTILWGMCPDQVYKSIIHIYKQVNSACATNEYKPKYSNLFIISNLLFNNISLTNLSC